MSFLLKKKSLKKIVSSITMLTTVIAFSGVMALSSVAVAAEAIVDGDLIKSNATNSDGTPTIESLDVYIVKVVGTKKFKRLILSPTVFDSYGHLNYGDIQTVSEAVMGEYTTSSLVRVDTDPDEKVYAMAPSGDTGAKGWVNLTSTQFVDEAGSDADSIYTINSVDGASYTTVGDVSTVAELTSFYSTGTLPDVTPVPVDGDITIALAADTPAANTIIAGQATADLAHILFTNSGSGEMTVNSVSLKRIGVSADATLENVYLFDGAVRLTDAASVSEGNIVFTNGSGVFTIPAGETKNIAVKSDIKTATSGQTVGIEVSSAASITSDSSSITGSFPISGNVMSIANVLDLAAADFIGTTTPSTNASLNPAADVTVWQRTLSVTQRSVTMNRVAFREVGSIDYEDIQNFKLFVDGVQVGETQASLDSNGYVTFTPATELTTGSKIVRLTADVINGSGRTMSLSLKNVADIDLVDSNYNVNIRPTVATATFSAITAGTQTISSGSVTVQKSSDSPSGNAVLNSSDALLGRYTMTAYGEAVKVDTVTAGFTYSNAGYTAPVTATRTLTVATAPLATETVTIGACVITFVASTGTDDVACADNAASIYVQRTGPTNRSTTEIANVIDTLTGVSDATQGALTLTAGAATTTVFTAPAALTGSITYTDGTTGKITGATTTAGVTQVGTLNAATTLRSGRILVDGVQVGSTTNLVAAGTAFSTNFSVVPGTVSVLEIRADIYDNDGTGAINSADTILAKLMQGTNNGQGASSSIVLSVPGSDTPANTVTVATGALTLAKFSAYANQTIVVPQTAYKLGEFVLTGNSSEDISVTSIQADFTVTSSLAITNLSDVYITYDGVAESTKGTVVASGNTWSVNHTLGANDTAKIAVYGNISTFTVTGIDDTVITSLKVSGNTVQSSQSVTSGASVTAGQTMTAGAGSITAAIGAETPAASIVAGLSTVDVADYKFTTANDSYTVTEVVVTVGAAAASTIQNVILKDGASVLKTVPVIGTTATFSGLSVIVDANDNKVLTVALDLGSIGTGGGTSGALDTVTLTSYKANNSQGTESTTTASIASNVVYAYKAVPVITSVSLPTAVLSAGENTLAKFTVSSAGTISWKKAIFNVAQSNSIVDVATFKIYDSSNQEVTATCSSNLITVCVLANEQEVSGSKTYELRADVGTITANASVTAKIAQAIAFVAPTDYSTVAATSASFVWSDLSVSSHTENTSDWNNEYLVSGLPTTLQGISN